MVGRGTSQAEVARRFGVTREAVRQWVAAWRKGGRSALAARPRRQRAWVPLTRVAQTNSIYIETMIGSGRHQPVILEPGEILLFDAYHLEHGSIANRTETTRVSCDLRFVPVDKARAQAMGLYPSGHIF